MYIVNKRIIIKSIRVPFEGFIVKFHAYQPVLFEMLIQLSTK